MLDLCIILCAIKSIDFSRFSRQKVLRSDLPFFSSGSILELCRLSKATQAGPSGMHSAV